MQSAHIRQLISATEIILKSNDLAWNEPQNGEILSFYPFQNNWLIFQAEKQSEVRSKSMWNQNVQLDSLAWKKMNNFKHASFYAAHCIYT